MVREIEVPFVAVIFMSFYGDFIVSNMPKPDKRRTRGGGGFHRANRETGYIPFNRYSGRYNRPRPCTTWKWAFGGLAVR